MLPISIFHISTFRRQQYCLTSRYIIAPCLLSCDTAGSFRGRSIRSSLIYPFPGVYRQEGWPLETCLSVLQQSAAALQTPHTDPEPPRDRRAFWAAYRVWPCNRRVPAGPASALLRPGPPSELPLSAASSPDPVASPSVASPAAQPAASEVYRALVEAVTDPAVVAAAAETFQRALLRRARLDQR